MGLSEVAIGDQDLTIDEFSAVISGLATLRVSSEALERTARGAAYVLERLRNETPTYGVNTGFGHASDRSVSPGEALALAQGLVRYHGCGTGVLLSANESRAVVVARLVSLARGYSAVRPAVLEALAALVNSEVYPCIPSEGSVGASGDLTPLSYVAALLQGERRAWFQGEIVSASEALERAGLAPLELQPKESLAIMNGTSVMGGLLALAWPRARRLSRLSAAVTAFACEVMGGVAAHFHPKIFELKAHPGTVRAARWIREGLQGASSKPLRLQDRYSLRCAPHVLGVLEDTLEFSVKWLTCELNGVNDNPLVDPDGGDVYHGGNFYGGHLCAVADSLKTACANAAELLERQLITLCDERANGGLPAALLPEGDLTQHGFKAMQIGCSSLVAEALKTSLPTSVFSRSTENHNQDKVSMGTIAARECLRVLELSERVLVIETIALAQAAQLNDPATHTGHASATIHRWVRDSVPFTHKDREFDEDIQSLERRLDELYSGL